jgi:hypothetical protein
LLHRIRLDLGYGHSIEAISGSVLLSQILSSLLIRPPASHDKCLNHSGIHPRLAPIRLQNQSHPVSLSQLPIHVSLFLAIPPLQLNDFASCKIVDRGAQRREMANGLSDIDLPAVYGLPGIEPLLCG